ncbi:MAG: hypothetical protein J6Y94_02770, partial [Bacteriovoracaceae bacterium]|nr:hypothetical protein [Bacteriovoracaceae bacterium]
DCTVMKMLSYYAGPTAITRGIHWGMAGLVFVFLYFSPAGWAFVNLSHIPCVAWLQASPALTVSHETLSAQQAQGLAYLRQAYADHLRLGKTFAYPAARAAALAVYWPQEQSFVDDFLPTLRETLTSSHWPSEQEVAQILQDADRDLLELTGGELQLTLHFYQKLEQQIDCLRQRSLPVVQEILGRINQLFLNLQDEQRDLWPNLERRSRKWPSYTSGHQFTLALRTFFLQVQQPMIILGQHIKQDNLISLNTLLRELQTIEQILASYPRFMATFLREHPTYWTTSL